MNLYRSHKPGGKALRKGGDLYMGRVRRGENKTAFPSPSIEISTPFPFSSVNKMNTAIFGVLTVFPALCSAFHVHYLI